MVDHAQEQVFGPSVRGPGHLTWNEHAQFKSAGLGLFDSLKTLGYSNELVP